MDDRVKVADALHAWSENSPDRDFFFGDQDTTVFSMMQDTCADGARIIRELVAELAAARASDTGRSEAEAKEAAARVCHDEQVTVWSDEMSDALSLGGYLRSDMNYEDVLSVQRVIIREVRSIVESAFGHPELAGRALLHPPAGQGETRS